MSVDQQNSANTPFTLRLRGRVERIDPVASEGVQTSATAQLRDLELAISGEPLDPSIASFLSQAAWQEAGVKAGDTVIFTTLARPLKEPAEDSERSQSRPVRHQRVWFQEPRAENVVVVRRPKAVIGSSATAGPSRLEQPVFQERLTPAQLEAPEPNRPQARKPVLLLAAIAAVLTGLAGGVIGWSLGQLQQPQQKQTMTQGSDR